MHFNNTGHGFPGAGEGGFLYIDEVETPAEYCTEDGADSSEVSAAALRRFLQILKEEERWTLATYVPTGDTTSSCSMEESEVKARDDEQVAIAEALGGPKAPAGVKERMDARWKANPKRRRAASLS